MSKILLLIALLGLVSCGGEQPPVEQIGDTKTFEPVVTEGDPERVQVICDALAAKEGMLSVLVASAKEYTFSFAQKGCDEAEFPEAKLVPTRIQKSGSSYFFSSKNGEAFGFSDVETSKDGIMELICGWTGVLESPLRSSPTSKTAIWWTTMTDPAHCKSGFGNICINIQTGSSKDGYNYKIHSNEWIKFQVSDDNQGFFVERKLISSAGCSKGKRLEMRAKLK